MEAGRHIAALYWLHVKVLGSQFRLKVANALLTPEKKRQAQATLSNLYQVR